jgi:hypothetical protein
MGKIQLVVVVDATQMCLCLTSDGGPLFHALHRHSSTGHWLPRNALHMVPTFGNCSLARALQPCRACLHLFRP